MDAASQPILILAVTGTRSPTLAATDPATSASRGQSFSSEDPPFLETTFLTGHPKLRSIKSGCFQSIILWAASAMRFPLAPKSWTPTGLCPSSNSVYLRVLLSAWIIPSADTNSVVMTSAPISLQILRKMRSVTPAMGAR